MLWAMTLFHDDDERNLSRLSDDGEWVTDKDWLTTHVAGRPVDGIMSMSGTFNDNLIRWCNQLEVPSGVD